MPSINNSLVITSRQQCISIGGSTLDGDLNFTKSDASQYLALFGLEVVPIVNAGTDFTNSDNSGYLGLFGLEVITSTTDSSLDYSDQNNSQYIPLIG